MREDRGAQAVLLVEADATERERYAATLESVGFEVLACSGPTEPDYACVGGRTGMCPLIDDASVVILDVSLDSEALMRGTTADELLWLYLTSGRPVVALGSRSGPAAEGALTRLRRHSAPDEVLPAVRALLPGSTGEHAVR